MQKNNARRARLAAVVLAPVFVLATPALAFADGPGDGDFQKTSTVTGTDGARTTTVTSCAGPDGQVTYQQVSGQATAEGKTQTATTSGMNNNACDSADISSAQGSEQNSDSSTNGSAQTSGTTGAPLIVFNMPGAGPLS